MNSKELISKAAEHTARARAINDEYAGKAMPAEAARVMQENLSKATDYRRQSELVKSEEWLREPQYKHNMVGGLEHFGGDAWTLGSTHGLEEKTVRDIAAFIRGGSEAKAALVEDTDGQNLLPSDFAGNIVKSLSRDGVIRGQAHVRPTNRRTVDVGSVNIASGTWGKLELGDPAPDGLGNPPADRDTITVWDLNVLIKIGRDEMEDSDEGLVELIRQEIVAKLAEQEDDAFANGLGDSSKQPLGIARDTTITQNVTAAVAGTYTVDDLSSLVYAVPGWARKNGAYFGNSAAEEAVALMKNSLGEYLWQPATAEGRPATFRGYPWHTVDGLPSGSGTAGKPLFFGDMRAAYMIADRRKFTVDMLRERFIDEGKIGLLVTHRVGGSTIRPLGLAYYAV